MGDATAAVATAAVVTSPARAVVGPVAGSFQHAGYGLADLVTLGQWTSGCLAVQLVG